MAEYKIIRLITDPIEDIKDTIFVFRKFIHSMAYKYNADYILTYGGFLKFNYSDKLCEGIDITNPSDEVLEEIYNRAEKKVVVFFNKLGEKDFGLLKTVARYLTIGIDRREEGSKYNIELIALYDLQQENVIHWTGKFYPLQEQEKNLIRLPVDSHFVSIGRKNLVILGCHDLNVMNHRARINASKSSFRLLLQKEFDNHMDLNYPDIILHHPHFTSNKLTWSMAWNKIKKDYPDIECYASGICYSCFDDLSNLRKLIYCTQKGTVCNCVIENDDVIIFT